MTLYISSDNIGRYAKLQGANSYVNRDEVVVLWDELDRKGRNLAKNITTDVKIQTSDPRSVPDKWKDDIISTDPGPDTVDLVKMLIANPARHEVYEMLVEEEPPEPLLIWWVKQVFYDADYYDLLSEACLYGLFRGDKDYLMAAIAFGIEAGEGRFHWPESQKEDQETKELKQNIIDEHGYPRKEVDLAWDYVKVDAHTWVGHDESEPEVDEGSGGQSRSLLDL